MQKIKERSPLNSAGQKIMGSIPRENTSEGKVSNNLEFLQRIENLMNVIQQKDTELSVLQHNYDLTSRFIKVENSISLEWTEKLSAIERENSVLRSEKQVLELKKNKILKDLEKSQEEVKQFYGSIDEYRICRLENQSSKSQLVKKVKFI